MSDNTEELQSKLEKALASIAKLEAKNQEILEENKKRKAEADSAKEAAEAAAEEAARKTGDAEAIEKAVTKRFEKLIADKDKELAKRDEALKSHEAQLSTLLIDNALKDSLSQHGVTSPAYQKAVTAMLKLEAKLDGGEAKIGDLPLSEAVAAFVASDEGKAFVAAPANGGANANGSKTMANAVPSSWNLTQYLSMKDSDPAAASAYAQKHNKSFD